MVDTFILLFVAFGFIMGYKNGLVKTVFKMLSFVVSCVATFFIYPIADQLFFSQPWVNSALETVAGQLFSNPQMVGMTFLAVNAFKVIIIFAACMVALSIVAKAMNFVQNVIGLKFVDSIAGAAVGAAVSTLVLILVFSALRPLRDAGVVRIFDGSLLAPILFDRDGIFKYITDFVNEKRSLLKL